MTPKEKAIELVRKYSDLSVDISWLKNNDSRIYKQRNGILFLSSAKQCTLIAVDEILDLDSGDAVNKDYWDEVKKEIELL